MNTYWIDGEAVTVSELISRAQDLGYAALGLSEGFYTTSDAAHVLRQHGHAVTDKPPNPEAA